MPGRPARDAARFRHAHVGNDNGGHDFSNVLTDTERDAIIEYLKTL